jgi:hypothetical protein
MRLEWKLVWDHLEIVLISTQDRCTACVECTIRLKYHFGHTPWNSWVTWVMWNLASVRLEVV